jgi:transcriptional repressor NrdR
MRLGYFATILNYKFKLKFYCIIAHGNMLIQEHVFHAVLDIYLHKELEVFLCSNFNNYLSKMIDFAKMNHILLYFVEFLYISFEGNMRCKSCGNDDDKVLESRTVRGGVAIRRRRVCLQCGHRFTTYEEIVRESLQVVKRDGRLEEFSRPKLLSGVMRACQKRPISMEQIDKLVDSVIDIIEENYDMEIPSHEIGKLLMKQLKKIDEVAAVRFASVYRRFESIDDFVKEVKAIGNDED